MTEFILTPEFLLTGNKLQDIQIAVESLAFNEVVLITPTDKLGYFNIYKAIPKQLPNEAPTVRENEKV